MNYCRKVFKDSALISEVVGAITGLLDFYFNSLVGSFWIYGPFITGKGNAEDGQSKVFENKKLIFNQELSEEAISFFPEV